MPFTSTKLAHFLNFDLPKWKDSGSIDLITVGHKIGESSILFAKIEDEKIEIQLAKLHSPTITSNFPPMKNLIEFDEFTKMDIRVGKILTAEKVEKADKLLKLTVDTGLDTRTVVSGIAAHYDPAAIIGQKVTILMNLAPRKIRGIESQGMILMAEDADGKLAFVAPTEEMEVGGEVR